MNQKVWAALLAVGLGVLGACKPSAEEIAAKAAASDAAEKAAAHAFNVKRAADAKAEAERVRVQSELETKRVLERGSTGLSGEDACKKLAADTRACNAGKPCMKVDLAEFDACAAYMKANGLDRNPG